MLEWIPIELRPMSVLSLILFFFGGVIIGYLYSRVNRIDRTVNEKTVTIERLSEMCENTEKLVVSIKDDNRKMIGWIREDTKATMKHIDDGLSEIRAQLYRGE